MINIVLGTGFGDEGKGLMVDHHVRRLTSQRKDVMVVRFNGGGQAGHTVVRPDGLRHVFSHFGSGTLAGAKTFWSRFCPVNPLALIVEGEALMKVLSEDYAKNASDISTQERGNLLKNLLKDSWHETELICFDPRCPVTTWWDIAANRELEIRRGDERHGSCGVGFGTTVGRHEETPYKLYALDLAHPELLMGKLQAIRTYYEEQMGEGFTKEWMLHSTPEETDERFAAKVAAMTFGKMLEDQTIVGKVPELIFEGAQGILLDQDHGVFPHVTRSYTTSRNAFQIMAEVWGKSQKATVLYVSRTYLTRHGAGPLANEGVELKNAEMETNKYNDWQGHLRRAPLDPKILGDAIRTDAAYHPPNAEVKLALTCNDQLELVDYSGFPLAISYKSYGPCAEDVKRYDRGIRLE